MTNETSIVSIKTLLFEKALAVFCILGLIAVIMGGIEVYLQGRLEIVVFYISAYLPALICFVLRKKIPYHYLTNIVLLDIYILSLLILSGVGLSGAGIPLLITFCVLTTTFQGIGRGLISILMGVIAILLIGSAMNKGFIPIDIITMTNSTRIEAWVMASVMLLLIGSIMVVCLGVLHDSLERTIKTIQQNTIELQTSNNQLEQAMKRQKETKNELLESKSLLEAAFESTADGILVVDKNRQWTKFNQNFTDIWNIPNSMIDSMTNSFDGKKALDYIMDNFKNPDEFISKIQEIYQNKEMDSFDTLELKDGRILEHYSKPQKLNNQIVGRVWSLRDITEQRRLESQLQLSQKMDSLGTLAGGIAHDFNNILFPILGHTEMLLEDAAKEDAAKESLFHSSLNQIYTGALRAKDLVNQILAFSRQDKNQLILMKMQPVIKEALKLIRSTIPAMIKIKQDIRADCGIIKADPTQIHQIVMNLATNAYHAMEETGGELTVTLEEIKLGKHEFLIPPEMKSGIYACLSIADTGVGMTKSTTEKIFDPFFTTKEKGKGTGMGLSVVHGIVNSMRGHIQINSEPNKGSQFKVYFPTQKNAEEEQFPLTKEPIQGGTEQILLVDDEQAILTMARQMLERLGYQVISQTSSLEAIETFHRNPEKFDLVITDMAMPHLSGDKLAVELRRIRHDIPILICTGFSEAMSEEKAATLGIRGFLMKPIRMKDFSQKIREVLDNNRTR